MSELVSRRIFNVAKEKRYNAWVMPQHLKNWWGSNGFTDTFYEFDLHPGGKWRFTMHGHGGKNYENESEFEKTIPNGYCSFSYLKSTIPG